MGFVLAFVLGLLAVRLKLSPIVGYLLAGVLAGPFTPGFVADATLAPQLAEIGVILLLFGVGLHFSPSDLVKVQRIALPGAIAQITAATVLGWAVGRIMGLGDSEAVLFGFTLATASTVVLLRAVEERGLIKTDIGRIAVGWLLVEDVVIILALVVLPLIASADAVSGWAVVVPEFGWTFLKIAAFLALMYVAGRRAIPGLLIRIAHLKSRELFTLGVLAIALGIAWLAYAVFGASFALGAFVAGLVLSSTPLGHSAAERSLPLRDAFAVLFFVSIGMLFDPSVVVREPLAVAATVLIVILGKSAAAIGVTAIFRRSRRDSLIIAASLAQIGEFTFILASLGRQLDMLSQGTHDLVLAAALISISLNPFMFRLAERLAPPEPEPMPGPAG